MISEDYVTLARATWRRDFLRDHELIVRAHQDELQSIERRLPDVISANSSSLHPKQKFELRPDSRGVAINEGGSNLARCYVNGEEPGKLSLQFFDAHANEVDRESLKLDRYSEDEYVWHTQSGTIPASEAADYIVRRVLDVAIDVVRAQTPGEGSSRQFIS